MFDNLAQIYDFLPRKANIEAIKVGLGFVNHKYGYCKVSIQR
ncbi:hypothetical protein HMPREF0971_00859 [Segatella oris F0302]|uniref:Uncharacterized protein n=1 Tax=Segatella oris F0302 TaxID=649760 RepID=D1QPG9_9BACT|nr:hypothetical protein HMPREF0971_00859 [Segatella oris F0302]